MVLVTGTAGSGKSTTQACIIDRINRTREAHIITLEDPIEYLHRDRRSIVSQREIAIDTTDYLSALRSCLRKKGGCGCGSCDGCCSSCREHCSKS